MQSAQFQLHAEIEEQHWWFVARRRIMRRLVAEVVPPSRQSLVVDVGCGTGANVAALAGDYDCLGIDTDREAVELARARFPGIRFVVGRAPADSGELAGRANLFLLMDVLEHVEDDFAVLSELLAAASPGCHFLVTVPARRELWSEHDESFGHWRRYDRPRFERLWEGLPVEPLVVSYFNSRLYPMIRAVRAASRLRGKASGRAGTDFWLPRPAVNRLLEGAFAGESRRLVKLFRGKTRRGYPIGASLLALLRRGEGEFPVAPRPQDVPADEHRPVELAAL